MEYITFIYAESHFRILNEENRQTELPCTMKNKNNSEPYEAFKMFDADGDGKVKISNQIKINLTI